MCIIFRSDDPVAVRRVPVEFHVKHLLAKHPKQQRHGRQVYRGTAAEPGADHRFFGIYNPLFSLFCYIYRDVERIWQEGGFVIHGVEYRRGPGCRLLNQNNLDLAFLASGGPAGGRPH